MTTVYGSAKWLPAMMLGLAIGGCSGSGDSVDGASGTTSEPPATGGGPVGTGGGAASGGTMSSMTGGTTAAGGSGAQPGTGGSSGGSGGTSGTGGTAGMLGGGGRGGLGSGGSGAGGRPPAAGGAVGAGGMTGGAAGSGATSGGGGASGSGGAGPMAGASGSAGAGGKNTGTCTASMATGTKVSGTGPHQVTVETNPGAGIKEGTIFRPTDLGGDEKYPIFVWGEGGCSENGLSNSAAMAEIASHGYFVIADGTPNNSASRSLNSSDVASMGKPLLAYVDWAIAENDKPCSAYYQSLDTTKIAANGFSCGGLMAEGTAGDPRITTWGLNSSGLFSADQPFYKTVHTPVLIVLGGSGDIAYENGERDYDNISALGQPIMLFSKALGHGGDLFSNHGGDFTKIDLAWLNWWLKGDETATGKGLLVGSGCPYCSDSAWEVKSKNLP